MIIMKYYLRYFWRKEAVCDFRTCKILAWYQESLCPAEYFPQGLR